MKSQRYAKKRMKRDVMELYRAWKVESKAKRSREMRWWWRLAVIHHRLWSRSSERTSAGAVGSIDGVVGKFVDSGGVPAMDCSKQSESGGVCFGLLSVAVWLGSRQD